MIFVSMELEKYVLGVNDIKFLKKLVKCDLFNFEYIFNWSVLFEG